MTQYSDYVILVHSESRTPNVPYGEHFTTISQVCLTWESSMKTRVKCSMEVKFKKSVMWASRVESGALEGSGGYLKELVKQLQELAETQGPQLIRTWESNKQVEDGSAAGSDDSDGSDKDYSDDDSDSDTSTDSGSSSNSDPDDGASIPESTTGVISKVTSERHVTKATADVDHEGTSQVATSNGHGSSATSLSVTRRPVATEMSRAQSLLSQQFLRSAPPVTIVTESIKTTPARLSLDSVRTENSGVNAKDQLMPLPSEKKSALTTFWESLTPPIITVAAAALTFGENKVSPAPALAIANTTTKGALAKDDSTTPSATTTTKASTTTGANTPSAPTGITATAPVVATGVPSTLIWDEFVRRGLAFFSKTAASPVPLTNNGNSASVTTSNSSAKTKDHASDSGSLSSGSSSDSQSYDDMVSRPDGTRVKFTLPSGSRRSQPREGSRGSRSNSSSSSVRSPASAPSLASTFRDHGQRNNERRHSRQGSSSQNEGKALAPAQQQQQSALSPKQDHRSWLSRMVFACVILGMAITALNVWHLFTVVSSVIEVVQQGNELSSNGRIQQQQQQRPSQFQQHRRPYLPPSYRYHQYPSRYYQAWESFYQQQQHQDSYYYQQQQQHQDWVDDEDFKSWNQNPSSHNSDPEDQGLPTSEPEPASVSGSPSSSAPLDVQWEEVDELQEPVRMHPSLDTVQVQKEQLKAEIAELLAMLEHARKEFRQQPSHPL